MTSVGAESVTVEQELIDALEEVIRERSVVSIYQPIVDLTSPEHEVVAYEALARGPKGSPVEFPDKLFGTARAAGRLAELDWVCPLAAAPTAMDPALKPP